MQNRAWSRRAPLHGTQDVESIEMRHPEVENHHIVCAGVDRFEGRRPIAGDIHRKSHLMERPLNGARQTTVVVDDQYTWDTAKCPHTGLRSRDTYSGKVHRFRSRLLSPAGNSA